ncbi:MAG: two-component regulator propeller domain-containing protein [Lewinella sp.]|uniref:two-component regulator propeller domain-containing protein n=1 Tax=Lewinella sp. TaxID=2004506 RepID=UPI003D6ADB83
MDTNRLLIFGVLFFLFSTSETQTVSFQHLSKKEGLSQTSVFAIAQDAAGFMWFGTRDGLNKFDGYQFEIYRNDTTDNSLAGNDIRTLYADTLDHKLWVGTISGLSCYDSSTDKFTSYYHNEDDTSTLSDDAIRSVFRDRKGRIWVGTSVGLNLFNEKEKTFQQYYFTNNSSPQLGSNDIEVIFEDAQGQLIFGTASGLYYLSETAESEPYEFQRLFLPLSSWPTDIHIKSIQEDEAGNLWLGALKDGVAYWNRTSHTLTVYRNEKNAANVLSNNNIRAMCLDNNGDLWVGTFDGLNVLKKGSHEFIRYKKATTGNDGLSDNSIRSLFIDQRGSLWVGAYYGGINHFDENYNRFTNFHYAPSGDGLGADVVSSFAETPKGNLWIGTEGGGLNFYDRSTGQFKQYPAQLQQGNALSGNNVKQLLLDGNQLWIGTFQAGLNLLDLETETFRHYQHDPLVENSLAHDNVYGLKRKGHHLWILTYGGGLDILDLKEDQFCNFRHDDLDSNSLSSDLARVFLETQDGQLWIGTERGVNKVYLGEDGLPARFEVFLDEERIYTLQEDSKQRAWIGTISNGVYCLNLKSGKLDHFTMSDGLPGNTIFGILEAANEELWISTNNGLSRYSPEQGTFTNYNYSNGLENLEYNFNAYYKTRAGELLFGGIDGFTLFDPEKILANEFIPALVFTQLKKNNRPVVIAEEGSCLQRSINETESITFKYNEANFTLGFSALDYFSPENNHYAYKLEGLDREWKYSVGETEASYTIQREGTYVFRLRGGNSDGIWNPEERTLEIIVLPPPWRSWWAYLIYLALASGLAFGLVRFVRLRHRLQLEQIAKEQQEELTEIKLRFFTNITHEFRTPLTLILGPLQDLLRREKHPEPVFQQLSLIERNAQRLLNLVNQVLNFRKLVTDHETMKIVHSDFVNFIGELFLPFQETAKLKNITYTFVTETPAVNLWFDQDKLEKVFFNLLSNAFKFTPPGGEITLLITESEDYVEVRVKDNGVGVSPELEGQIFKRFYEKSNLANSSIKSTGIGLAISKQMVELHHGKIFLDPTSNNNDEKAKGATFVVQLLKGRNHFTDAEILTDYSDPEETANYEPMLTLPATLAAPPNKGEQASPPPTAPLLLIVEDNPEVRSYIEQVFAEQYRLVTAENGLEGLAMAKKHLPDLVVSDVMMPEMDGITFCGKLKTDLEISHIPVILLTARTASLFKIEGLRIGADDYITKPFHPEELVLRVRNTIQSRQEARDKFARVLTLDPKKVTITSADEDFLNRALQFVEVNMNNTQLSVENFAHEMAVSRPLLFIKIKALTNQTPNNFVKSIRLKRAAQLLQQGKFRVTEVADHVGFRDPRYFSKCFQKEFNQTPSEYMEANE